jgi:hypothetical protein
VLRRVLAALTTALGLSPAAYAAEPSVAAGPAFAAAFDKAFIPGFSVTDRSEYQGQTRVEQVPFKVVSAGNLVIVSGRICAADPFVQLSDRPAFTQAVPNGSFPVRLAVAEFPTGGLRTALARVHFKSTPVVRWSLATIEGQDPTTLKDGEIFGYPVDAGTGSFFDPVAGAAAKALLESDSDAWEAWQTDGEANGPKVIGPYQFLLNVPLGRANAIMFGSGWGDGFYASYFGFDVAGDVVTLVTDFAVLDWTKASW